MHENQLPTLSFSVTRHTPPSPFSAALCHEKLLALTNTTYVLQLFYHHVI